MDITAFIDSLIQGAQVLKSLAVALAMYALGFWYMITAMTRAIKLSAPNGANQQFGWPSVLLRSFAGCSFVRIADFTNMWVLTITGEVPAAINAMSVTTGGSTVPWLILSAALYWCALFGAVAIIRGIQLLVKAGDNTGGGGGSDKDPIMTGFIFLISGAIGINLSLYVNAII